MNRIIDGPVYRVQREPRNERESHQWLDTMPACSGPCGQDSRRCKTPEACQMPSRDIPRTIARTALMAVAAVAVVSAVLQVMR